jgi:hypothetical protein
LKRSAALLSTAFITAVLCGSAMGQTPNIPHLRKQGDATQLVVQGQPMLLLGGEVFNSSSSSIEFMAPIWKRMTDLHLNTLLIPVSWEMVEPKEGAYDFSLVDGLIRDARKNHLHMVFLWLASWKNGMSSYMPLWVKEDYKRFPRVRRSDGTPVEVLTPLSENSWKADAQAFGSLMRHLKAVDSRDQTVVMIQVENEVGVLGDTRDHSPIANQAFAGQVPAELMQHLVKLDKDLTPEFRALWVAAGQKTSGTWEEVFGSGIATDEIFMAWNYARYVDHVAAAGRAEYPIPLYVNAWLDEGTAKPGDYPSGCPESHVMDVWQAGAPHIDMMAPDLYASNFAERCQLYSRQGNPLFIPEMPGNDVGAHNVFYAYGTHNAIGTSPFGIDRSQPDAPISKSYAILEQIAPLILAHQGLNQTIGFVLDQQHPKVTAIMGGYEVDIALESIFGRSSTSGYGIVIATGDGEYVGAGSGFRVTYKPITPGPAYAGIDDVEEITMVGGAWVTGRHLNGDETEEGSSWRFPSFQSSIQSCRVYRYE